MWKKLILGLTLLGTAHAAPLHQPGTGERLPEIPDRISGMNAQDVRHATYQLYIRISPPGRTMTQTVAFCTASFYLHDTSGTEPAEYAYGDDKGRPTGYYGTTAGHCLDAYGVIRDRLTDQWWGLEFELGVMRDKSRRSFVPVEVVDHGFTKWREWRNADEERREYMTRPSPSDVDDWGIIRAAPTADLNTLCIAEPDTLVTGASIYLSSYPWALGKTWSAGVATTDYRLPGTLFDHYIATDYAGAPGSSGAPVVDARGCQVGIHVAGFANSTGVITPVSRIDLPEEDIGEDGSGSRRRVPRGFMYHEILPEGASFPEDFAGVEKRLRAFAERVQ